MLGNTQIGFVGLGAMGAPMVNNLISAGFALKVFDPRPGSCDEAVALGGKPARSLLDLAETCEIIAICVLDESQVLDVIFRSDGLFAGTDSPRTVVLHSTLAPQAVERIALVTAEKGWKVLDAPVSGGSNGALEASLTVMVGGEDDEFQHCKPMFDAIGKNVFHIGSQPGAGSVMKLCNNIMAMINNLATLEAAKLARLYDIEETKLISIVNLSTGRSWWTENWGYGDTLMSEHERNGHAGYHFLVKDLEISNSAAHEKGHSLVLAGLASFVGENMARERCEFDKKNRVRSPAGET